MKKLIVTAILSMALSSIFAQPEHSKASIYHLRSLRIVGTQHAHPDQVANLSGLEIGKTISLPGHQISSAIKRIYKAGFFDHVEVQIDSLSKDQAFLSIHVQERPRVAALDIVGVDKKHVKALKEKIDFVQGSIYSPEKVQQAQRKIQNYFYEKGYYESQVQVVNKPDAVLHSGIALSFQIDKGKRNKIEEVRLSGNTAVPDAKLKKALRPLHKKSSPKFWKKSRFSQKALEEVKGNILAKYLELGHKNARIVQEEVNVSEQGHLQISLEIEEGKPYYHGSIRFIGNYSYSDSVLQVALGVKEGDVFNQTLLDERIYGGPKYPGLSSLYLDNGYLFFSIDPVQSGIRGDVIDLELRIQEGSPTVISKVSLSGNTKTSDEVILRMLRTQPGNIFRRSDLMRSQRELINMNYFDPATLNIIPTPNQETGTVDLEYVLAEKPSDKMQLSGGWSPQSRDSEGNVTGGGLIGTLQFTMNNFSTKRLFDRQSWRPIPGGDGQQLNIALQSTGRRSNNFSINFLEPWMGGKKPNSLGFGLNYYSFQNNVTGTDGSVDLFHTQSFAASLDYGTFLTFPDDYTQSRTSLSYRYYDIRNPGTYYPEFAGEDRAFVNAITLRQTFTRNSLNHPVFPSTGSFNQFSAELTPPYSLFRDNQALNTEDAGEKFKFLEYYKLMLKSQWFANPTGKLVLQARLDAGYLGAYSSTLGVSPFERFVLGGAGIMNASNGGIRGIEAIPLRGYKLQVFDNEGAYYTFFNRLSFEVRHPINLTPQMPLWVLGFAEAGNASEGISSYKFSDIKKSAGLGFRMQLPMIGLLGLDWGYGFDNDPTGIKSGHQFHFIFGREF